MTDYLNSFYNPKTNSGDKILTCETSPKEYRGYQIFHRIKTTSAGGNVFDIVKDGVCVGMNAGINGAKSKIDELLRIPSEDKAGREATEGEEADTNQAIQQEAAAGEPGVRREDTATLARRSL